MFTCKQHRLRNRQITVFGFMRTQRTSWIILSDAYGNSSLDILDTHRAFFKSSCLTSLESQAFCPGRKYPLLIILVNMFAVSGEIEVHQLLL